MSSYKQEHKRLEELGEVAEIATRAAAEVKAFVDRHPEIKDCLANYSIIYQYFPQALEDINESSLEDSYANHPKFRESLARHASEQDEREVLQDRILELSQASPDALRNIKSAFRFQNLDQLRAKVRDLEARQAARAKTPQELRAEIQAARPGPETELPRDISKEQILHMWEPATFRYWAKRLGSMEPITRRINEK
jgi:hypothetical protein